MRRVRSQRVPSVRGHPETGDREAGLRRAGRRGGGREDALHRIPQGERSHGEVRHRRSRKMGPRRLPLRQEGAQVRASGQARRRRAHRRDLLQLPPHRSGPRTQARLQRSHADRARLGRADGDHVHPCAGDGGTHGRCPRRPGGGVRLLRQGHPHGARQGDGGPYPGFGFHRERRIW